MHIATLGRGTIGGTLARLWRTAGHEVRELGRDDHDVSGTDVVLVAVPYAAVPDAIGALHGLERQVVIDATNRFGGEPPAGHASMTEYLAATVDGPVAKAFNLNFGALLEQAATTSHRPGNLWVGHPDARATVEELTRAVGMVPLHAGGIERAGAQEAFAGMMISVMDDLGAGPVFYRFAAPSEL